MGPLTREAQVLGRAAMEESLSPVARARRRFKAGRPTKAKGTLLSPLEALTRAVNEYAKLQRLMQDETEQAGETFHPDNAKVALVYCTTDNEACISWLPPSSEGIPAFGTSILTLAPLNPAFLGIIFYTFDGHAKSGTEQHIFSVLQWVVGPTAETVLREARDKARAVPLGN